MVAVDAVVFVFVFPVSVVSVVCDQVDQVVPAYQDDIDEVHELDPVHQVDHKDEHVEDNWVGPRPFRDQNHDIWVSKVQTVSKRKGLCNCFFLEI